MSLFKQCGLLVCAYQTDDSFMSTLYLLRPTDTGMSAVMVDASDMNEFAWIEQIQQAIAQHANGTTVWMCDTKVSTGIMPTLTFFSPLSRRATMVWSDWADVYATSTACALSSMSV
jgi:hypothetical protein